MLHIAFFFLYLPLMLWGFQPGLAVFGSLLVIAFLLMIYSEGFLLNTSRDGFALTGEAIKNRSLSIYHLNKG